MGENSQKLKGLTLPHDERLKIYARMKEALLAVVHSSFFQLEGFFKLDSSNAKISFECRSYSCSSTQ